MRREMHKILARRVRHFIGRAADNFMFREVRPLHAEFRVSDEPEPFAERLKDPGAYRAAEPGLLWGRAWQSAWFHVTGRVPREWAGADVVARINLNSEVLVFDPGGCPVYSLTGHSVFDHDYGKDLLRLFEPARGGETVDFWMEAAANGLTGIHREPEAPRGAPSRHGDYRGIVRRLELCRFNTEVWHYWIDMDVLFDLYQSLSPESPRAARILEAMHRSLNVFAENADRAAEARRTLRPVFDLGPNPADLDVVAIGHGHIDTGWLWPVRESVRKCARTFASQIALLDRYPEYVFGASQPQHYAFVKTHYPALFEKIRKAVAEGRWECQGGMWVEADCNVPSGESLVRQLLHGKNFFMDEFGKDVRTCWIPDVFGYSAALPQILRKAGIDTFLTQKMSWCRHNEFPHNTFRWRGIDGTEILTHFPPENNYNSPLRPASLIRAQNRFKENGELDVFVSLFGIGDGGGGPKEEHVEYGLRQAALNGVPRVRFGPSTEAFDRMSASVKHLAVWSGELYLEMHRATLTTQARTKRGNRKLERALRETEMLLCCLPLENYPAAALDAVWKKLLINQFHDILPGSSIRKVYEVTEKEHAEGVDVCRRLCRAAAGTLLHPDSEALTLFNSLSHPFAAPIRLPQGWRGCGVFVEGGEGAEVAVQDEPEGPVVRFEFPALSFVTLKKTGAPSEKNGAAPVSLVRHPNGWVLENRRIRYTFAENAALTGIFDKETGTERLPEGASGNGLSLYVDRPYEYDAWDIDLYYEDQFQEHAVGVSSREWARGPVRAVLAFDLTLGRSRVVQRVSLAADSKRLDFDTEVDWRETHRMLRVAFPTGIMAREATFDIQYGYLRRPTHRNTSWDLARFEVAAHRYVDVSDRDYGMALLNDGKYGHKVLDGVIDLNLLRSPTDPDPDADLGEHRFTYSLLPHVGGWPEPEGMAQAEMLNQPPLCLEDVAGGARTGFPFRLAGEGVSLEVVKKAEHDACFVLRLVETLGGHSRAELGVPGGCSVIACDLLEWNPIRELPVENHRVVLTLKPFEILTCLVKNRARGTNSRGESGGDSA